MSSRNTRDAVVGLLIALTPFAYKQFIAGNDVVAAVTLAVMLGLVLAYRFLDAKVIEAALDADDADDLKPILRRLGKSIRRRLPSRSE
jgi:predicted membrane-bound mannosyltransferase